MKNTAEIIRFEHADGRSTFMVDYAGGCEHFFTESGALAFCKEKGFGEVRRTRFAGRTEPDGEA